MTWLASRLRFWWEVPVKEIGFNESFKSIIRMSGYGTTDLRPSCFWGDKGAVREIHLFDVACAFSEVDSLIEGLSC